MASQQWQKRPRTGVLGPVEVDFRLLPADEVVVTYAGMRRYFPSNWRWPHIEMEIESFVQHVNQVKGVKSNGIPGQSASAHSGHPPPAQFGGSTASSKYCKGCLTNTINTHNLWSPGLCDDCFTKLLGAASPTPVPAPPAASPTRASLKPPTPQPCMACRGGSAGPAGLCAVCHNMWGRAVPPALNRIKPSYTPLPVSEIRLGEIIAWRGWWGDDSGYLRSFSQEVIWPPGEAMEGRVSSEEHGAGVYAFKTKKLLFDFMRKETAGMIWGSVALWGDVVEHELGWRAQFAASLEGQFPADGSAKIDEIRKRYGLER